MPLPVILDTYQATLVWTNPNAPRPATTTLHFIDSAGGGSAAALYTALNAAVTSGMWTMVATPTVCQTVNITPLDGATAGLSFATGGPAKWTGSGGADAILQGSVVVSLKSAQRGPRGRNRIFLPFVGEGEQLNGVLLASDVTNMQNAWNTFLSTMNAGNYHPVAVSALYAQARQVTSIVVRNSLKTQRRRARRS